MKKLHILLITLNILSIGVLVQMFFHIFSLIPINIDELRVERINSSITSLCLGIITSSFFYVLLVYIPEKKKHQIARNISEFHLRRITNQMTRLIACLAGICSIKSSNDVYDDINPSLFEQIFEEMDCSELIPYISSSTISKNELYLEQVSFNHIHELCKSIQMEIDILFSLPSTANEDNDLIKVLSHIKQSGFFIILETEINSKRKINSLFQAKELYCNYLKLIQFVKPSSIALKRITKEEALCHLEMKLSKLTKLTNTTNESRPHRPHLSD